MLRFYLWWSLSAETQQNIKAINMFRDGVIGPDAADKATPLSYKDAGVDIDAGNELVERIKPACKSTRRPGCDADLGWSRQGGGLAPLSNRSKACVMRSAVGADVARWWGERHRAGQCATSDPNTPRATSSAGAARRASGHVLRAPPPRRRPSA